MTVPVAKYLLAPKLKSVLSKLTLGAACSKAATAWRITSGPMPSPGMTPSFIDLANCSPLNRTTLLVLGPDSAGQFIARAERLASWRSLGL
jgi:hypothetical protein